MGRTGFFFLVAVILSTNSLPAAFISQKGNTIHFDGKIYANTDEAFIHYFTLAMLESDPDDPIILNLNSGGGDPYAAHSIAGIIRSAQKYGTRVITKVGEGSKCFSACPIIFVAGDERVAAEEAHFLFHGMKYSGFLDKDDMSCEIEEAGSDYIHAMKQVSPRLAKFLNMMRIITDNNEVAFNAVVMKKEFPGFITSIE